MRYVYVLYVNASLDVVGQMMQHGEIIAVFLTEEAAKAHLDSIEETYTRRKSDYEILKFEVME